MGTVRLLAQDGMHLPQTLQSSLLCLQDESQANESSCIALNALCLLAACHEGWKSVRDPIGRESCKVEPHSRCVSKFFASSTGLSESQEEGQTPLVRAVAKRARSRCATATNFFFYR